MQLPQRTPLSGASLVRVLARLTLSGVPASDASLPDRLSHWLGWTDAIALSGALDAPAARHDAPASEENGAALEAALCARTRATLTEAIHAERRGAKARRGAAPIHIDTRTDTSMDTLEPGSVDFAPFRQRYQSQQQSMDTAIGDLRGRLRTMLATRGERQARLALVDATLERALGARERSLLATVPTVLEARFTQLRDAAQRQAQALEASPSDALQEKRSEAQQAAPAGAWLAAFRDDMHAVLIAELDVRFQPLEGLLAALRAS